MFQRRKQEGAKFPFPAVHSAHVILFQKAGKESLCEILGVGHIVSLSANVGVEGIPISATEFRQRLGGLWRWLTCGREDDAPVCRRKLRPAGANQRGADI